MPQEEIIKLIQKYVALLNGEGLSVRKAFLFGSYATGLATQNSDIDVMIVSDKFDETDDRAAGKMWQMTKHVHTGIEPFLIGMDKYLNDESSPLISSIKQNGIEVFS
jgi:predicted nucleotidyltransferase